MPFDDFCPAMYPGYQSSRHIAELREALQWVVDTEDARLIVVMPPRHSKTVHTSELLPAYALGRHPDWRIIHGTHTDRLARRIGRRVRNNVQSPNWPFDRVKVATDRSAATAWDIQGTRGGYVGVGREGTPTGEGADLMVIDDPIRHQHEADSPTVRDAMWDWYVNTMRTRLEPGGRLVITATRWHEDDLIGRLLAAQETGGEKWRLLHMPALGHWGPGEALWPERWNVERLARIQAAAIGTRLWEVQYQGQPTKTGGNIFKAHWWGYWYYPGSPLPPVTTKLEDGTFHHEQPIELPRFWDRQAQSWDMNFGKPDTKARPGVEETGSYVVGLTAGLLGFHGFVLDCYRERTDFVGTIAAMLDTWQRWPAAHAKYVENKANGPAILSMLGKRVPGLIPVEPMGDKEARARAVSPLVLSGNWYLPHPAIAPWVTTFVKELSEFPKAANDDQVDAFSQLVLNMMGGAITDMSDVVAQMEAELGDLMIAG